MQRSSAPPSLAEEKKKKSGTYAKEDVINQLIKDFRNKCYICEMEKPVSIHVEHLKSHQGDIDLKFAWENLFLSCGHCNTTKMAKYDDILDCTNPKDNVLGWIKYIIIPFASEKVKIKALNRKKAVKSTVALLDKVYNGTKTATKINEAINLRSILLREVKTFTDYLHNYLDDEKSGDEKPDLLEFIKERLKPDSAFSAFKYWIIMDNKILRKEFSQYVDQEFVVAFEEYLQKAKG